MEGGCAHQQLENHHAQRPPVHLRAVRLAQQNLGGEVIGRTFRDAGLHRGGRSIDTAGRVGVSKHAPAPYTRTRLHGGVAVVVHRGGARVGPAVAAFAARGGVAAVSARRVLRRGARRCAGAERSSARQILRVDVSGAHAESRTAEPARTRRINARAFVGIGTRAFAGVARTRVARDADVGEPKVGELYVPPGRDQQVVRLEVAVDDPARVAVLQREHDLRRVLPAVVLAQPPELLQQ